MRRHAALKRIRGVTRLLDTRWTLPGTSWRFGLDPVLGLIPIVGAVVTLGGSIYLLIESRRLGLPKHIMAAMAGNVALDFVAGEVPLLGDIFDFAFKAHDRNLKLLERWMERETPAPIAAPPVR